MSVVIPHEKGSMYRPYITQLQNSAMLHAKSLGGYWYVWHVNRFKKLQKVVKTFIFKAAFLPKLWVC